MLKYVMKCRSQVRYFVFFWWEWNSMMTMMTRRAEVLEELLLGNSSAGCVYETMPELAAAS